MTGDELRKAVQEILERAVIPFAEQIGKLWADGLIPMAFDVDGTDEEDRESWRDGFGWDGQRIAGVKREVLRPLMRHPAELRWLETQPTEVGPLHVLLWSGKGSLLLVGEVGRGWSTYPGTSDGMLIN